jgi:WhiB family redox-sensing transcriptional regulator
VNRAGLQVGTRGSTLDRAPTPTSHTKPNAEATGQTGNFHALTPAPFLADANCGGHPDPELFFPTGPTCSDQIEAAKAICNACPVETLCGAWAIDNAIPYGIWGGMDEWERRAIGLGRPPPSLRRRSAHHEHGRRPMYQQGCRCAACKAGNATWNRENRVKQQQSRST